MKGPFTGPFQVELKRTPVGLHPNCRKRLRKVPRLTQNTGVDLTEVDLTYSRELKERFAYSSQIPEWSTNRRQIAGPFP